MASSTSSRLLILACLATNRAGPECRPAIDGYDGSLPRTPRAAHGEMD